MRSAAAACHIPHSGPFQQERKEENKKEDSNFELGVDARASTALDRGSKAIVAYKQSRRIYSRSSTTGENGNEGRDASLCIAEDDQEELEELEQLIIRNTTRAPRKRKQYADQEEAKQDEGELSGKGESDGEDEEPGDASTSDD